MQSNSKNITRRRMLAVSGAALGVASTFGFSASARASAAKSNVQDILDALKDVPAAERTQFLRAEAAKEGKVVLYGSDAPNLLRAWGTAFTSAFPEIEAEFVRVSSRELLQRSVAESQAGRPVADVLHAPAVQLAILQNMGLLARYVSPEAASFSSDYLDPEGYWTTHWFAPCVVAYNRNRIETGSVPVTLDNLAAPELKGMLGRTSNGGRWVAGVLKALGDEQGGAVIKQVAEQKPRLFDSNSALLAALSSGQIGVGFDANLSDVKIAQATGAPIDYVVPDPLLVVPMYQFIMKDAPHPHAAALLYDWILSKEGQAAYPELSQIGPRPDIAYPGAEVIEGAKNVISLSAELLADPVPFDRLFEDLFIRT
ncbi:ABC transporter substrate-binding protein [Mycoplana dimorpha]|uniref:Iron(III) transport system substrate-binding protein n=1 Tax=Mycoplana dimorpha TaxID=28320 RepID=A0A2T5BAY8_MYCDI|nr:extracellular solute-binding protein [Mycoplana dimorpha]PTM96135.1 iron(III) transport system substrate-binding protein [Mycoplana dimorpha]